MGKDADSGRRYRAPSGSDASRGGQGPTVPMQGEQSATGQAASEPCANVHAGPDATPLDGPARIPFPFIGFPLEALNLLAAEKIKPVDTSVLLIILRFRQSGKMTAWIKVETIARLMGMSPTNVRRSLRRLAKAGLIKRECCGRPDPSDSMNMTGYRFALLFQSLDMQSRGLPPAAANSDGSFESDGIGTVPFPLREKEESSIQRNSRVRDESPEDERPALE